MGNDNEIRPQTFNDYVGNYDIKEVLKIIIKSKKIKGETLPHILISGGAGLGKSSLATIICNEFGIKCFTILGSNINSENDLYEFYQSCKKKNGNKGGFAIFCDEIHQVGKHLQESFYQIMEDFKVNTVVVDKFSPFNLSSMSKKNKVVQLEKFTLIAASTDIGKLKQPLVDRFTEKFTLNSYDLEDCKKIVKFHAKRMNVKINDEAIHSIASKSFGVPRIIVAYLSSIYDFAIADSGKIDIAIDSVNTEKYFILKHVDKYGLNDLSRRYLMYLYSNMPSPIGIKNIASGLQTDEYEISNIVEPSLLRLSFIQRNSAGRKLTNLAESYLLESNLIKAEDL